MSKDSTNWASKRTVVININVISNIFNPWVHHDKETNKTRQNLKLILPLEPDRIPIHYSETGKQSERIKHLSSVSYMKYASEKLSCWWKEISLCRCIQANKWRRNDKGRISLFCKLWWSSMSDKTIRWKANGELYDGWIGLTISETPLINSNSIERDNQTLCTQHCPWNILAQKSQYV